VADREAAQGADCLNKYRPGGKTWTGGVEAVSLRIPELLERLGHQIAPP
jgi:hypothetical protein